MKDINDEDFIDMMDRVHLLSKKIFSGEALLRDKEFRDLWNRNFYKIRIAEEVKKNPYASLIYYHNYLFLMSLEAASYSKAIGDMVDTFEVKQTKSPHLRIVQN